MITRKMTKKTYLFRSKMRAAVCPCVYLTSIAISLLLAASVAGQEEQTQLEKLRLRLPKQMFFNTPADLRRRIQDQPRTGQRFDLLVPKGLTNVALRRPVTCSDPGISDRDLALITDGDKEADDGSCVALSPGLQHVQVDLGDAHEIYAIAVWHDHSSPRIYSDIIVQTSDDPEFGSNVLTVFNNDTDNSAGLGYGKDFEYVDTYEGLLIDCMGTIARYVRFYSNGSTVNSRNHYCEAEIYGRSAPQWNLLFNEKDLTGWLYTVDMVGRTHTNGTSGLTCTKGTPDKPAGWVIEDGALVNKAYAGYIWTQQRFGNFVLDLEVTTTGNSGIFFRTDNVKRPECVQTGIELQVESKGGPGQKFGFGAIYGCLAPSKVVAGKPFGEWSRVRLTCNANKITVEINGDKVIDMDLDKWDTPGRNPDGTGNKFEAALKDFKREGHIGLQDHGDRVKYRNIRIMLLDGTKMQTSRIEGGS
jgi:hypothetical protein